MTPERRTEIVEILESSRQTFLEALAGITEEAAQTSAGPGQWSVLEVIEHLSVAENGMFRGLSAARPVEVSLEDKEREAEIAKRAASRAVHVSSPERARPTGRFGSLTQALGQFVAARDQTIRFAEQHDGDLCLRSVVHPLFGVVNGYELLLIMAGHTRRHAAQILEIKDYLFRVNA